MLNLDQAHMPGTRPSCADVRGVFSDLLDVRRGALPGAEDSPLSSRQFWAMVERHLTECRDCSGILNDMEAADLAFTDFSVGELPAQHFAGSAQKVRDRIKAEQFVAASAQAVQAQAPAAQIVSISTAPRKESKFRRWAIPAASAISAAALVAVIFSFKTQPTRPDELPPVATTSGGKSAVAGINQASVLALNKSSYTPFRVTIPVGPAGVQPVSQELVHTNADSERVIKSLQDNEGRFGYLIFAENFELGKAPLMGVELRTTRDEDKITGDGPRGLLVYRVHQDSPAQAMGLRVGDFITGIEDKQLEAGGSKDAVAFLQKVKELGASAEVNLNIIRDSGGMQVMKSLHGKLGQ